MSDLINRQLQQELSLQEWQVTNVIQLIDEGNTIPFIARYRKEQHGTLSDEILRNFSERLTYLRNLEAKKEQVIGSITEQEKMTPELLAQIQNAKTMMEVEDLYRPFRPKRRTRAIIAKERGLEPLATLIFEQTQTGELADLAAPYVDEAKEVPDTAVDGCGGDSRNHRRRCRLSPPHPSADPAEGPPGIQGQKP